MWLRRRGTGSSSASRAIALPVTDVKAKRR
jgi:hypothetical protein